MAEKVILCIIIGYIIGSVVATGFVLWAMAGLIWLFISKAISEDH